MSDDKRAQEERRRKIRELEASLFGGLNTDAQRVDLPEVKNVDEYSTKFGKAERQKRYQSPTIEDYLPKKPSTVLKLSKNKHKFTKKDDKKNLLSDNEDDDDEENYDATKSLNQIGKARRGSELMAASGTLSGRSRFLNGYSSGQTTPGAYRPDPEQMDGTQACSPDDNPRKSIIQNLKKRHGINNGYKRSDSLEGGDVSKQFNIAEYQELLEKAKLLRQNYDQLPSNPNSSLNPNPKSSLNPNPNPDKQRKQDLQRNSGEQDRKFTEFLATLAQKRRPPSVSETGSSSSDTETVHSGSSLRDRDHLRDLGATYTASKLAAKSDSGSASQSSDLKNRDLRRNSLSTLRDYDSMLQSMVKQKLAPIEKPSIKIDETPKAARSKPVLREKSHDMVNFDHLELPSDTTTSDIFRDMPNRDRVMSRTNDIFGDMTQHESFRDMPKALEDMPTDIFDKIPRAVTAREEKRLEQYHKKLDRDRALRKAQVESRRESDQLADSNKISLIATLFTSQTPPRRQSGDSATETDFMFALFIQQNDGGHSAGKDSNPGKLQGPPVPKPDPNDQEVGHFCAPFCPGFCEANFCIFHAPMGKAVAQKNGQK